MTTGPTGNGKRPRLADWGDLFSGAGVAVFLCGGVAGMEPCVKLLDELSPIALNA
jgi:hypothetical protein